MHETENRMDIALGYPQIRAHFSEQSSQPMIAVEGTDFIVRHANAAFLHLSGMNEADLIGHRFATVCPEGETNGCLALLNRVYTTGLPEVLPEQLHNASQADLLVLCRLANSRWREPRGGRDAASHRFH
jgi:hypothetical protein